MKEYQYLMRDLLRDNPDLLREYPDLFERISRFVERVFRFVERVSRSLRELKTFFNKVSHIFLQPLSAVPDILGTLYLQ